MAKKKKKKNKIKKMNIRDKRFDTSKVELRGMGDLSEILTRLKRDYVRVIFEEFHRRNMDVDQICVTLFRSNRGFDPKYINAVFLRHFVNPQNEYQTVAMSIQLKPFVVAFSEKGSKDKPLTIDFLGDKFNNAISLVFTELKDRIDVELVLAVGNILPAFDYYRDVKFFNDFDPYEHGLIPYIFRSDILDFKVAKSL